MDEERPGIEQVVAVNVSPIGMWPSTRRSSPRAPGAWATRGRERRGWRLRCSLPRRSERIRSRASTPARSWPFRFAPNPSRPCRTISRPVRESRARPPSSRRDQAATCEDAREEEAPYPRVEISLLHDALARPPHVQEVVVKALVARRVGARATLNALFEEAQRDPHAPPPRLRGPAILARRRADRAEEGESDDRDAGRRSSP